jgi:hypothetical protein
MGTRRFALLGHYNISRVYVGGQKIVLVFLFTRAISFQIWINIKQTGITGGRYKTRRERTLDYLTCLTGGSADLKRLNRLHEAAVMLPCNGSIDFVKRLLCCLETTQSALRSGYCAAFKRLNRLREAAVMLP